MRRLVLRASPRSIAAPAHPPSPPLLPPPSIIPRPPIGCACPAAPTSARPRWQPPRSTPTAMARPAARPSPRIRRSTASTSIRPCRATRAQQRPQHVGGNRRRRRAGRALRLGVQGLCSEISPDDDRRGGRFLRGAGHQQAAVQAYGDVLAAWRNFLATRNKDRPFVLIGHSQGTRAPDPADRHRRSRPTPRSISA